MKSADKKEVFMKNPKFRCWCPETKRLFDVDYISWDTKSGFTGIIEGTETRAPNREPNPLYNASVWGNEPRELLMYTGLKDRDGKEIYEGDIVKCRHLRLSGEREYIARIEYEPEHGGFIARWNNSSKNQDYENFTCDGAFESKVIGNIYQNSELLK